MINPASFAFFARFGAKKYFRFAGGKTHMNPHAHKVVGSTKDEKLPIPIDRTYILQKKTMED